MRIAIIGGGISGLSAGYRLHRDHEVTLFEANDYPGGHTNTVDVETEEGTFAVDTGFIVFNDRTYPRFLELLSELDVAYQPTRMSFSVSCSRTGWEYSGSSLDGLFAQRRNLLRPAFLRMLWDFRRFQQLAQDLIDRDLPQEPVREFLRRHRFSKAFEEQYFLPMGAAIWSSSFETFRDFPIQFIAEFYHNHGLLSITDRPQWYVIRGGSKQYVGPLTAGWRERIRLNSPVESVVRLPDAVQVQTKGGTPETFDHVIMACHSDQALRMLGSHASPVEREILSAFPYQPNRAVLHTQQSMLPRNRKAWACWNYHIPESEASAATLTYNMNMLQSLSSQQVFCVTLNDDGRLDPAKVLAEFDYAHPSFDVRRKPMQARHAELIDHHQVSYCGAYWGNGFHEDGVVSALKVVTGLREMAHAV